MNKKRVIDIERNKFPKTLMEVSKSMTGKKEAQCAQNSGNGKYFSAAIKNKSGAYASSFLLPDSHNVKENALFGAFPENLKGRRQVTTIK